MFEERHTAVSFLETFMTASGPSGDSIKSRSSCSQIAQWREFSSRLVQPGSSTLWLPEGTEDVLSSAELLHLEAQHLINLLDDTPFGIRCPPATDHVRMSVGLKKKKKKKEKVT